MMDNWCISYILQECIAVNASKMFQSRELFQRMNRLYMCLQSLLSTSFAFYYDQNPYYFSTYWTIFPILEPLVNARCMKCMSTRNCAKSFVDQADRAHIINNNFCFWLFSSFSLNILKTLSSKKWNGVKVYKNSWNYNDNDAL